MQCHPKYLGCILRPVMKDARSYWGNSTSLRSCHVHSTFCWKDYLHKMEFLSMRNSWRAEMRDCLPILTYDLCNKELGEVIMEYMKIICMWTVKWRRIIWRKIITVIDATFAVAERSNKACTKTNQACTGFEPLTSAIPMQRSLNFKANKPTGSRSLNELRGL